MSKLNGTRMVISQLVRSKKQFHVAKTNFLLRWELGEHKRQQDWLSTNTKDDFLSKSKGLSTKSYVRWKKTFVCCLIDPFTIDNNWIRIKTFLWSFTYGSFDILRLFYFKILVSSLNFFFTNKKDKRRTVLKINSMRMVLGTTTRWRLKRQAKDLS